MECTGNCLTCCVGFGIHIKSFFAVFYTGMGSVREGPVVLFGEVTVEVPTRMRPDESPRVQFGCVVFVKGGFEMLFFR